MSQTAKLEPAAPAPVPLPLENGRVTPEGDTHRNQHPLWVVLRHADEIDGFFQNPALFLRFNEQHLKPYTIVRVIDDQSTIYSEGIILSVGHGMVDLVELAGKRTRLRAALAPVSAAAGWSIGHRGPVLGWCVLFNGEVRRRNLRSEIEAREIVGREQVNDSGRTRQAVPPGL